MIRKLTLAFLMVFVFQAPANFQASAKTVETPEGVVAEFQLQLIEVMKISETLSVRERFDRLAPAVDAAFHMPLMVQISVGKHWSKTSNEERKNVVEAFRNMSLSTLATLFDGYSGEVFEHQRNTSGPSDTIIVVTDLIKSDKSRVQIAYVARNFKIGWRIIDVVVDGGISELKVRKSEYRLILQKDGMNGLINLLETKSNELIAASDSN